MTVPSNCEQQAHHNDSPLQLWTTSSPQWQSPPTVNNEAICAHTHLILTCSRGSSSTLSSSSCPHSSRSLFNWCSSTFSASYNWFTKFRTSDSCRTSSWTKHQFANSRLPTHSAITPCIIMKHTFSEQCKLSILLLHFKAPNASPLLAFLVEGCVLHRHCRWRSVWNHLPSGLLLY
jgi:hypothetical protein